MTDERPERRIDGLAPRRNQIDLSKLQKKNREDVTQVSPPEVSKPAQDGPILREPARGSVASKPDEQPDDQRRSFQVNSPEANTDLSQSIDDTNQSTQSTRLTIYLTPNARDRARAAFRATAHLEGDKSWSDFVQRAVVAESARREAIHNEGIPFQVDRTPLSPGRPLS